MTVLRWPLRLSPTRSATAIAAIVAVFCATPAAADEFVRCTPDLVIQVDYSPQSGSWTETRPELSVTYRVNVYDDWSISLEENGEVDRLFACDVPEYVGHLSCGDFDFDFAMMVFSRIIGTDFEDGGTATTARIETGSCVPTGD